MALLLNPPTTNVITEAELREWRRMPTAVISDELNRTCTADAGIKPLTDTGPLVGPALTVRTMAGDNLALHHAVASLTPGMVLVIDAGGYHRNAVWGGILHKAAEKARAAGVIVDGAIRDLAEIRVSPVACYARSVVPAGPHKGWGGEINGCVQFGGTVVKAGDLVIGDDDGLAFVPYSTRAAILDRCRARIGMETEILRRIAAGEKTVDIMGLKV